MALSRQEAKQAIQSYQRVIQEERERQLTQVKQALAEKPSGESDVDLTPPGAVPTVATSCCGYALENLQERSIELAAAEATLAQFILDGADPEVIQYLREIVSYITGRYDELGDLRDDQC